MLRGAILAIVFELGLMKDFVDEVDANLDELLVFVIDVVVPEINSTFGAVLLFPTACFQRGDCSLPGRLILVGVDAPRHERRQGLCLTHLWCKT